MKVKILECAVEKLVPALIRAGVRAEMPSMYDGWRFNFNKHFLLTNAKAFVLVTQENERQIEGCLIFQMIDKIVPYMSFIEVAPRNMGRKKKYDFVAGCLIAFAFQQSTKIEKSEFKGALYFDVREKKISDEKKLMTVYSKKYGAKLLHGTKMAIFDEDGQNLMKKYLDL